MFFRHRSADTPTTRGQAMVEFAIILPLLALLLVIAVDFGRAFFGWVGVHNAARIAANAAASNPDAWKPPGDASGQNAYRQAVLNDLEGLNCDPPAAQDTNGNGAWDLGEIPAPQFENRPTGFSAGDTYEIGDHAVATVQCAFDVITPLAGAVVGDPLEIAATAQFMVRGGIVNGVPVAPAPPPPDCNDQVVPNMIGQTVLTARGSWTDAGFTGSFSPTTGSDDDIVTAQTTSPPSSPNDCLVATASVTVTHEPAVACSGTDVPVPSLIGQTVGQARDTWTADFTGSFTPATGSDSDVVDSQTTSPPSTPGDCVDPSTSVTVTHAAPPPPQCTMPQLVTQKVNDAEAIFRGEGFTGDYFVTQPPNGNYTIQSQSLTFGQEYACTSNVVVAGN